ncbi:MAG: hypothetical protein K2K57_04965 [Oscillospiraceae bacterium]|nr:hypothetical protein [Oscillospiraceae bacterium]
MKIKKLLAGVTAFAAISALSVSTSAADWSQTGYADDDPSTVNIISTSADGITFTASSDDSACKARITLSEILADPADVSKVYSGSWTVTYDGLSSISGTEIGWMGGGTYAATCNSAGYGLSPNDWGEDGTAIWEDSQSVEDSFKWLLPSQVPTDAAEAEFVFMDWSGQPLVSNGITVSISNLKLFDKDGNEIAQKAYGGEASAPAAVEDTSDDAETVEDTSDETAAAPAETEAATEAAVATPDADTTATAPVKTGNTSAAAIAAVMAVAGAAALVSKKK